MTNRVKTAVLVSGSGTNLQALIDMGKTGKMPHVALSLVVSNNKDAFALERAKAAGIKTTLIDRAQYRGDSESFERALLVVLAEEEIELILLAGFLSILSEPFTRLYHRRILNVHPSLIPSFCGKGMYGLRVHEEALQAGVKVTGATVHYVDGSVDRGEILLQKAVEVRDGDTPEALQKRVMKEAEWVLLPAAAEMVASRILEEANAGKNP